MQANLDAYILAATAYLEQELGYAAEVSVTLPFSCSQIVQDGQTFGNTYDLAIRAVLPSNSFLPSQDPINQVLRVSGSSVDILMAMLQSDKETMAPEEFVAQLGDMETFIAGFKYENLSEEIT